jgi:hypothetical protein
MKYYIGELYRKKVEPFQFPFTSGMLNDDFTWVSLHMLLNIHQREKMTGIKALEKHKTHFMPAALFS